MASRAREGCQPVRQTVLFLVILQKIGPVEHVFRGEQKAQTVSQNEGLIELGSCDRVPRSNGMIEADKIFFSYAGGSKRHFVL